MFSEKAFHLKPFSLFHHKSSMRVGTDALLLGVEADTGTARQILEVGTGSGIISLLLASRCEANIEAIDIHKSSVEEAALNFFNSPFHYRLRAFQSDFVSMEENASKQYDLIISNPPFFINDRRSKEQSKSNARHGDTLSFDQLCFGAKKLLQDDGKLVLVLPYEESHQFISIANQHHFHLQKKQLIFPKRGLQPNRVNLHFGLIPSLINELKMVIREEDGHFSQEYKALFKNYLLSSS